MYPIGYGESLLTRLANAHPMSIAALTYQYRMNEEICNLSSQLTYEGVLKCGNDVVKQRRLNLPGFPRELPPIAEMNKGLWPWLKMTISPGKPVIFVDTDSMRKTSSSSNENQSGAIEALEEKQGGRAGGKVTNPTEASIVRYIIHGLVATGLSPSDIGVISPFRAQVRLADKLWPCNCHKTRARLLLYLTISLVICVSGTTSRRICSDGPVEETRS